MAGFRPSVRIRPVSAAARRRLWFRFFGRCWPSPGRAGVPSGLPAQPRRGSAPAPSRRGCHRADGTESDAPRAGMKRPPGRHNSRLWESSVRLPPSEPAAPVRADGTYSSAPHNTDTFMRSLWDTSSLNLD